MWNISKLSALLVVMMSVLMVSVSSAEETSDTDTAQNDPPPGGSGNHYTPPEPLVDWQRKVNESGRLESLGFGLLGDSIETHTGALSFEHTDVSLPGNSSLDVSIRRRIRTGGLYKSNVKAEFGDWELITPRIKVTTANAANYRTGSRCSSNNQLQRVSVPYPKIIFNSGGSSTVQANKHVYSNEYSNGYILDVPTYGTQSMLKHGGAAPTIYPNSTDFVTASGWKIDCISGITGGGEGYEATAPNGTVYRFDRFYEIEAPRLGFLGHTSSEFDRYVSIVAATRVTDVHGNTVDYSYDSSNRLMKIEANDGRIITLSYTNGTDMISRVSANGRHWDYDYGTNTLEYYARFDPYLGGQGGHTGGGPTNVGSYPTLTSVTLPDGKSWTLDMQAMSAEVPPALSCIPESFQVYVTHPYGTEGKFFMGPLKHTVTGTTLSPKPNNVVAGYCPNPEANAVDSHAGSGDMPVSLYYAPVWMMSTTGKTLTAPDTPTSSWGYEYELDTGLYGPNDDQMNWTNITQPDGTVHKYFHGWGTETVTGNQLVRKQILDGTTVVQDIEYTNIWESDYGNEGLNGGLLDFFPQRPRRVTKAVTLQDGDTFTTENDYNTNRSSSLYSFGNPTETRSWSNYSISNASKKRITQTTYEHNTSKWILGLPKTVTRNGRLLSSTDYTADGQIDKSYQYNQAKAVADYAYNSDGTVASFTDGLDRITKAENWHRGQPQTITRAFNTPLQQVTSTVVDGNGWVMSQTDPSFNTTTYQRDSMGRLTRVTPHTPSSGLKLVDTEIIYDFAGGGAVQTIKKGPRRDIITYDGLFRPILNETKFIGTGGYSTYTNTAYDGLGRVTFKSFPSSSATSLDGTATLYDGLGRITESQETVLPYAKTRYLYYANHRTYVINPEGRGTQTYRYGYDGPGKGDTYLIRQPTGIDTWTYRNVHGEVTRARQRGPIPTGGTIDKSQYYYYNSNRQLCRHRTLEGGDTVYKYNAANELTDYQKGLSTGTACSTPTGDDKVGLRYDALGRPKETLFTDPNTPDIWRDYDANGNLTEMYRGAGSAAVKWDYHYDSYNRIKEEHLTLDNRAYDLNYYYNAWGHMIRTTLPTGRNISYVNDGLGRNTRLKWGSTNYVSNGSYHPSGAVAGFQYADGQVFTQTLNARLQPQRLLAQDGAVKALDLTYGYDRNGRITSQTNGVDSNQSRSYGYDRAGRLTTATSPAFGAGSFSYDALGNLRSKVMSGRTVTNSYDSKNRLTASNDNGTSRTVAYDNRGNITTLGNLTFLYDKADQPTVVSSGVNANYAYDGNMKRVKVVSNGKTIYNMYDAAGRLAHVDEVTDGKETDYLHGMGQTIARIQNNNFTYLHPDHLGSAQAMTDRYGNITCQRYYSPFGEELTAPCGDNQAGFTGHIKDTDTGLNYMQARYYDPNIGRFLSIDPVTFMDTGHPAMFNRYAYTFNDPVNLTDPTGECPMCIGALSSVVLGAVIRGATGGDIFDGKAIAADAALGAVGAGIIGKAAQLRQISQAGTGISKSVALGKHGERAAGVAKGGKEGFRNAAGKQRFTDGGAGTSGVTEVKNVATLSSSNIAQIGDEAAFAVGDATKSGAMTLFTRSGTGNIAAAQTAASNAGANLTVKTLPNTGANGFKKGLFSGEAAAVGAAAGGGCAAASGGEHC